MIGLKDPKPQRLKKVRCNLCLTLENSGVLLSQHIRKEESLCNLVYRDINTMATGTIHGHKIEKVLFSGDTTLATGTTITLSESVQKYKMLEFRFIAQPESNAQMPFRQIRRAINGGSNVDIASVDTSQKPYLHHAVVNIRNNNEIYIPNSFRVLLTDGSIYGTSSQIHLIEVVGIA